MKKGERIINHTLLTQISIDLMLILTKKYKLTPDEMILALNNVLEPILIEEKQRATLVFQLAKKLAKKLGEDKE